MYYFTQYLYVFTFFKKTYPYPQVKDEEAVEDHEAGMDRDVLINNRYENAMATAVQEHDSTVEIRRNSLSSGLEQSSFNF